MKPLKITFLILVVFMLVQCETHHPENVTVYHYGKADGGGSMGAHAVQRGDTVYTISQKYNLPMRDLIVLNNLRPPYHLQTGARVLLPAPATYRVRQEDTLYSISRLFDTSVTDLARLNNLQPPYVIKAGQEVRIPSTIASVKPVVREPVEQKTFVPDSRQATRPSVTGEQLEPLPQSNLPQAVSEQLPTGQTQTASVHTPQPEAKTIVPRSSSRFLSPVRGNIISNYGPKADSLHNDGINIKAPRGNTVRSAENGVVIYAGDDLAGYGNLVLVKHADNYVTAYAHMDKMLASKGTTVVRGQPIGTVGSTGNVNEPQLHFEIRKGSKTLNPENYLE